MLINYLIGIAVTGTVAVIITKGIINMIKGQSASSNCGCSCNHCSNSCEYSKK